MPPDLTPEQRRLANLRPPWTREEATVASRKGNKTKRTYSLRGALSKRLKARRPDGTRPWDDALAAFVDKLLSGDPRAIELAMNAVDGPQVATKRHEHTVSRELVIRPVPVSPTIEPAPTPPQLPPPQ